MGTKIHCRDQFEANHRKERSLRLCHFTLCSPPFLKIKTTILLPSGPLKLAGGGTCFRKYIVPHFLAATLLPKAHGEHQVMVNTGAERPL